MEFAVSSDVKCITIFTIFFSFLVVITPAVHRLRQGNFAISALTYE